MARVLVPKAPGSPWMVYREVDDKTGEIAAPTPEPGVTETEVRGYATAHQAYGPGGLQPPEQAGPAELEQLRRIRHHATESLCVRTRIMESAAIACAARLMGSPRPKNQGNGARVMTSILHLRQNRAELSHERAFLAMKQSFLSSRAKFLAERNSPAAPPVSIPPRGQ